MKYVPPIGGDPDDPYVDGNPVTGTEGSAVPAAALEHPMREILDVIETMGGLEPDEEDLTQLREAIAAYVASQIPPSEGQQPYVAVDRSTAQAVVVGNNDVTFDTLNYSGYLDAETAFPLPGQAFFVPEPGLYLVQASMSIGSGQIANYMLDIVFGGGGSAFTPLAFRDRMDSAGVYTMRMTVSGLARLPAGATAGVRINQDGGTTGASITEASFAARRLGDI
ncbi:MAG: hypothetical protein WD341_08885 [Tistlia sp.]|uniref:hypothetical protein n=1 Tax=Tistlia sp. TaxID=3057121 RepID=UPI0034A17DCC